MFAGVGYTCLAQVRNVSKCLFLPTFRESFSLWWKGEVVLNVGKMATKRAGPSKPLVDDATLHQWAESGSKHMYVRA